MTCLDRDTGTTASASFSGPFNLAWQLASLDGLSSGRAGWNPVTSSAPGRCLYFGHLAQILHVEGHERAEYLSDVVPGLWGSSEDDTFMSCPIGNDRTRHDAMA